MSFGEVRFLWAMLGLSALFALLALFGGLLQNKLSQKKKLVGISKMLVISAFLMVAIFSLHYAILFFRHRIPVPTPEGEASFTLEWWEDIFDAVVKTLRTFAMEEDYKALIRDVRALAQKLWEGPSWWVTACSLYASSLWVAAPVAGGAIIFEILASVFPRLRLWWARRLLLHPKLYFSCLNEAAVTLIGSIRKMTRFSLFKPVFIVTGVQTDKLEEKEHELLQNARQLGAICIREDIVHVSKNRFGRRQFFLISEKNTDNLRDLIGLTDGYNYRFMKKAELYLFTENDAYVRVEQRLREKLTGKLKEKHLPRVMPVHVYKKLITKMLVDVPLYEPLMFKKPDESGKQQLQVTILGNGAIGTEMLMTTYWMGQLLDCELTINVVSQDEESVFWGKLDSINTELRHTLRPKDPKDAKPHQILYYHENEPPAEPYCAINYIHCDVKGEGFIGLLQADETNTSLLDTDYFFVALGADDVNLELANIISRYVGQHHIKEAPDKKTVISYVVYDTALANTLNGKRQYRSRNTGEADIYMQAVGCLEDVYCAGNVYRVEDHRLGLDEQINYLTIRSAQARVTSYEGRVRDDYGYWSSRAQALHTKYKMYSCGESRSSVFTQTPEEYRRSVQADYTRCVTALKQAGKEELCNRLAWLEHRRWNAYMRTCGFRRPEKYDTYCVRGDKNSYKQMELKLHPCLVECSQKGKALEIVGQGNEMVRCCDCPAEAQKDGTVCCSGCERFRKLDYLDRLSLDLQNRHIRRGDFKEYDYPEHSMMPKERKKKWWEKLLQKEEKPQKYIPVPINTAQVALPREIQVLSEEIAKNVHENWSAGRMAQGWTYGRKRNDRRKKTPCLVPYEQLTEEEKNYDRKTAGETLKLIVSLGYRIEKEQENVQDQ